MDVYILIDTNRAARDCILSVHERLPGAELEKHKVATYLANRDEHRSALSFEERYRRIVDNVLVIVNKDTRDEA